MRLTVGPLPPAVYWRRRAIVLGALLLVVLVFYAACGGSNGEADRRGATGATSTPTPLEPAPTGPEPTGTLLTPETGAPVGPGGEEPAATDAAAPPQAPGGDDVPCADEEMTITPLPAKTTISQGTPVDIRLKIENSGDRSCSRDVGADMQELRIVQGAQTIWSSDNCGPQRGSDVRTFPPGGTREYMVTWNGKSSDKCSSGVPTGSTPDPGEYQVIARLGTKHSAPVALILREG